MINTDQHAIMQSDRVLYMYLYLDRCASLRRLDGLSAVSDDMDN
jgi:hypothetical protein